MTALPETVGYCGLICGICHGLGPETGCDCRTNPKPQEANCYQRNCCIAKGIDGCWECDEFPCDNGYFGNDNLGWRGVCVALVQYARDHGVEAMVDLVIRREGMKTNYSSYINKTPEEVLHMLQSDSAPAGDGGE